LTKNAFKSRALCHLALFSILPSTDINNKEKIEAAVQRMVTGKKRLWLVLSREWYGDKHGYAKAWLDMNYEEIKALHKGINDFANVQIYCYDLIKTKKLIE